MVYHHEKLVDGKTVWAWQQKGSAVMARETKIVLGHHIQGKFSDGISQGLGRWGLSISTKP